MSLKTFHLVFIACAAMLFLGLGWAAIDRYRAGHWAAGPAVAMAGASAVVAIALIVYGSWFFRKLRRVMV